MTSLKEQSPDKCFDLGLNYLEKSDVISAIDEFTNSIRLNPNYAKAYIYRAVCYREDENYELCIADCNKVIQLKDLHDDNNRTICNNDEGSYEFITLTSESVQLDFYAAQAYEERSLCYAMQKKYEPAFDDIDKAISLYESSEDKERCHSSSIDIAIEAKGDKNAEDYVMHEFEHADSRGLLHRATYFKLIENSKELDRKNKELENKRRELKNEILEKEKVQYRMQKLVEQFTHSLGNVIFPDTIYQVAERLKNIPDCRKDVLLLHEAYHSEIIIKLQGELLRQRYANTNPEKFRQLIRGCRRASSSSDRIKSIEDILDYAASRVTARFLNQHYAGLNSIRDRILSKKNVSLDALKQKFEDDILLNKSMRPIEWINQNLRPVLITEISPLWKKVFILSESHAEALLFGYFSEILFNAFKYADHDKHEFLTLVFDEKTINNSTYLFCYWGNPVKDTAPSRLGTGRGLDAIQEDLKQLNDTENPEESLLISQQKNQFQVTLFFKKDLLVNELPSLKIKRKADAE